MCAALDRPLDDLTAELTTMLGSTRPEVRDGTARVWDLRRAGQGLMNNVEGDAKPREVVDSWRQRGFPLELMPVEPATADQLSLAHDADYVLDILACRRENGFHNKLPQVAKSLPTMMRRD